MDRWIEALLGGRLRFHAWAKTEAEADYWRRVYGRWAELYQGDVRVPGGYAYGEDLT